jgi:mannose-6-phosphate isomerase-like protein (cupin superfamily)
MRSCILNRSCLGFALALGILLSVSAFTQEPPRAPAAPPAFKVETGPQDHPPAIHIPASDAASFIDKALATKQTQLASTSEYNLQVLRRTEAGTPEEHLKRTHVFFIYEGEATLVTGGSFVGQHEISPGELRGTSIANGRTVQLRKGDVVVVPAGTPHWFREVRPQITYYSVNIEQP